MSDEQRDQSNSGGGRRSDRGGQGASGRDGGPGGQGRGPGGQGGRGGQGGQGRGPAGGPGGQGRGPGGQGGQGRGSQGGRDGRGGPGGPGGPRDQRPGGPPPQRHQKPACELVVAADGASIAADVFRSDVPPEWREIPPVVFFKSGVFVRAQGAVKQVARDLTFDRAVVYAVWEDPTATYVFEGRDVRPGITCALLVPSADSDGPPWLPLQAVVGSGQVEIESGILSPWLDQVACARLKPQFSVAKKRLNVSTDPSKAVEADREALRDTLRWLVAHPDADGPLARLARVMLVDDGHGLQRYGVSLMHASDAEKREAIETILRPLAPEVGELMAALWATWESPAALRETRGLSDTLRALAVAVERGLSEDSPLQQPSSLALITSWLAGLFGIRTERTGRQPARSLFAVARAARRVGRQVKALAHADSPLPRFPLDRAENNELLREMSHLPRTETNLERLFRALSISESAWYFARPRRDHLRPFRIIFPMLHGYPNAARSFQGRFDHVFTGWSFRGAELRDDGVPDGALAGVFITKSATVTSTRAFARTVATPSKTGAAIAAGLRSLTDAPTLTRIGEFRELPDTDVVAAYDEAVDHDRMTWLRLQQAVAAAEYLITRSEHGEPAEGFRLRPPAVPGDPDAGVRSHFMYWRMFCRSIAWKLPDVYRDFIDGVGPRVGELPPKLQTEVFALVRRWALHSEEHRAHAASWAPWLAEAAGSFFTAADRTWLAGEWLDTLGAALAVVDREATIGLLERLAGDSAFDVGNVDRLIDGVRGAGWLRDLTGMPAFVALHHRVAGTSDVHGVRARVEWTRAALDRSRHAESVRWLLDDRAYPRVLGSTEFSTWFSKHGKRALTDPDGAIVELLEIAVRHIAPTHLDLVLRHLDARTTWPPGQHLAALQAAGRPDAVALRLRMAPTGTSADHATAVAALFETNSGRGLREAAAALSHFVAVRGRGETVDILRDGLAGAYERYRPFRFALDGFVAALSGWSLAELGLRAPARSLAATAAKWHGEAGEPALADFVGGLADRHACAQVAPALGGAIAGDDDALATALAALSFPDELADAVATAAAGGRKAGTKALKAALAGAGATGPVDAAVAAAVAAALDAGVAADTLGHRLNALAERAAKAGQRGETDAASEDAEEDASTTSDEAPTSPDPAGDTEAEAAAEPEFAAGAEPEFAAGAEPAAEAEATSSPDAPARADSAATTALVARRRETIAQVLAGALRRWAGLAPRLAPMGDETRGLLARASHYSPAVHALRAELFAELGGLRDDLRSLSDPRRVLTTDFLDGLTLDLDAADFSTLADGLRRVAFSHGADPTVVLDRRALAVVLPRKSRQPGSAPEPPEPEDEPTDGEGFGEGIDVGEAEEAVPNEPAATEEAVPAKPESTEGAAPNEPAATEVEATTDDTITEQVAVAPVAAAATAPIEVTRPAAPPAAPSVADRVKAGYAADAPVGPRIDAFGEPGVPLLLRHLAKRNGLAISVGAHRKRAAIVLKWGDR